MRFQNIVFILLIGIVFTGCGSCEQSAPKNTSNTSNINKTAPNTNVSNQNVNVNEDINSNQPTPIPTPESVSKNNEPRVEAVTLKPVIEAFCAAMRNGDNAALQKVYSQKALRSIQAEMRKEGVSTVVEYLENEPVGNKCQVVNEKIDGDKATAIVITETYPDGTSLNFEKENNEWKLTNESEEFDRVDNQ